MTTQKDNDSDQPKAEEQHEAPKPPIETAGGQYIGETEKNLTVPEPIGRPWWQRLWDKILMR